MPYFITLQSLTLSSVAVYPASMQVPNRSCDSTPPSSSWVFSFQIPERFTNKTMKCLEDVCISSTARSEIIASLHTRILQYTDFPSPLEYRTSCRRLVEKYPCLVDKTESGYVSNIIIGERFHMDHRLIQCISKIRIAHILVIIIAKLIHLLAVYYSG